MRADSGLSVLVVAVVDSASDGEVALPVGFQGLRFLGDDDKYRGFVMVRAVGRYPKAVVLAGICCLDSVVVVVVVVVVAVLLALVPARGDCDR